MRSEPSAVPRARPLAQQELTEGKENAEDRNGHHSIAPQRLPRMKKEGAVHTSLLTNAGVTHVSGHCTVDSTEDNQGQGVEWEANPNETAEDFPTLDMRKYATARRTPPSDGQRNRAQRTNSKR